MCCGRSGRVDEASKTFNNPGEDSTLPKMDPTSDDDDDVDVMVGLCCWWLVVNNTCGVGCKVATYKVNSSRARLI